jgi:hypothetical protein
MGVGGLECVLLIPPSPRFCLEFVLGDLHAQRQGHCGQRCMQLQLPPGNICLQAAFAVRRGGPPLPLPAACRLQLIGRGTNVVMRCGDQEIVRLYM